MSDAEILRQALQDILAVIERHQAWAVSADYVVGYAISTAMNALLRVAA